MLEGRDLDHTMSGT